MSIRINSFLGKFGFWARVKYPRLSSEAYLKLQFITRRRMQKKYTEYFLSQKEVPMPNVVNIETINRCNSTCAFCTANIHAEKRPFMLMDLDLYKSIIDQLAEWGYKGHLTLYGNNEPLLDKRIVELHRYAREKLPDCFIFMSTNGLILNMEKLKALQPYLDQLIINNYANDYKMHRNIREIYEYAQAHPQEFEDIEIVIQMRYLQEVLTNRAGSAPNKQETEKVVKETCLLPFTDMWIMPNGKAGLCCCDNFEVTDFGDLHTMSLRECWDNPKLRKVREDIAAGRQNYPFCKHCDFIDAGFRMALVKHILAGNQEGANRLGGDEKNRLKDRR